MKKTRFSEEQMVTILREADQRPVPEVAKKNGVSAQTLYAWRKHFGTLEPADVKRLRQLEQENGRLKKMVADRQIWRSAQRGLQAAPHAGTPKKMVRCEVTAWLLFRVSSHPPCDRTLSDVFRAMRQAEQFPVLVALQERCCLNSGISPRHARGFTSLSRRGASWDEAPVMVIRRNHGIGGVAC